MAVKVYSLLKDGKKFLSDNFQVKEFACKDGSDIVLIDSVLVADLQKIRNFFDRKLVISSGYRTVSYNGSINGADGSWHTKGRAADFDVGSTGPIGTPELVHPRLVAMFAESILPKPGGIGLYVYPDGTNWVHLDTGNPGSYWFAAAKNAGYQYFSTFLPIVRPMTGNWQSMFEVEVAQMMLAKLGYYTGGIDGKYGDKSSDAVFKFQIANHLRADGILGPQTFRTLFRVVGKWVE